MLWSHWVIWTVVTRLLHAPPQLAARGFTRRCWQCLETGGSGLLSSSLPFPAGCEDHRYLQKEKNTSSRFYFFLLKSVGPVSPFVVLSFFFRWLTALGSGRLWLVVGGFCHAWAAGYGVWLCYTRRRQTIHVDGWINDFSPPPSFLHPRGRSPPPWLGDFHP